MSNEIIRKYVFMDVIMAPIDANPEPMWKIAIVIISVIALIFIIPLIFRVLNEKGRTKKKQMLENNSEIDDEEKIKMQEDQEKERIERIKQELHEYADKDE